MTAPSMMPALCEKLKGMLTADQFRDLALQMEGAVEGAHMAHPDFRANGRIFATLHPGYNFINTSFTIVAIPPFFARQFRTRKKTLQIINLKN